MAFRYFHRLIVFVGLLLLISACGTPPQPSVSSDDLWTEARFGGYVQELGQNSGAALNAASQNEALAALGAIPSGAPVQDLSALADPDSLQGPSAVTSLLQGLSVAGLSELAPSNNTGGSAIKLPRGTYIFNGTDWSYGGGSKDLILKFPFSNLDGTISEVTIQIIWDEYKPTIEVTDGTALYEVPTGLRIRSYTDDKKSGFIDIYADWYKSDCGTKLLEPSKLSIKGEFGYDGAIAVEFAVNISKVAGGSHLVASNNTGGGTKAITIKSDGYVKVAVGSDSGKVSWNNVFNGKETRGKNCLLTGLKITDGELDFTATFTISGKTDTFQLRFTFDNVNLDAANPSVDLDGKIKVNGQIVVLFEGTLDASGQNLILTFADGSLTLAEFIAKYLGDLELDLGVPLPTLPL
jgi:hypothetical protein